MSSMTVSTIFRIAYGLEVTDRHDPYVELSDRLTEAAAGAGLPGAFLVDVFPFCACLLSF